MRRKILAVLVLSGLLLVGCTTGNTGTPDGKGNDTDTRTEGKEIPKEYQPEEAVAAGHVVIVHGTMLSDPAILAGFIEGTGKGEKKDLTVVQYTVEGDPIVTSVRYDGTVYRGVEDTTRDRFGPQEQRAFEFKYLKDFKDKERRMVILVDDDTLTFEKYIKSLKSSQSDDWIPHHILSGSQE
ncbi:MAG TPA: DUF4362 domain-containing protein [Clostridiaceae bacterium]|nr:DUF4362 domain-containing protein [Clostridiaceae bacterium]